MRSLRFYDQMSKLIDQGHGPSVVPVLAGKLFALNADKGAWPGHRDLLRRHPLHRQLLADPHVAHSATRPRGYSGDAALIEMIYTRDPQVQCSAAGRALFDVTIAFQAPEAVRLRRDYAEAELLKAHKAGQRILSLACGHFREAAPLIGQNLSTITVVDQDPMSLDVVRADHGCRLNIAEANVMKFLRAAAQRGETWDYIYTLGLTDYFDDRAMALFHRLLKPCLAQGGHIMLANFVPDHLAVGWMDAVMDWHLVYRTESELAACARSAGFSPRTWIDATDSIAFCDMTIS